MILCYGTSKFRELQRYMYTGFAIVYSGSKTICAGIPNMPRLPMFPDQKIERTWIEYFRAIQKLLEDHLSDYNMHKVK